jgi:hypothetical protein
MTFDCSLCGYRFDEEEMVEAGCVTCPTSPGGCGLVRCPSCGYEWPPARRSVLVRLLEKILPGKESTRDHT